MHVCPVCGYPKLAEPPRSPSGGGSYEICPSCGFQFGVDDDDRGKTYEDARRAWLGAGMPWSSRGLPAPRGWSAQGQLAALNPPRKKSTKPAGKAAKTVTRKAMKKGVKKTAGKATAPRTRKSAPSAKKTPRKRR